jgi:hypothetical protein
MMAYDTPEIHSWTPQAIPYSASMWYLKAARVSVCAVLLNGLAVLRLNASRNIKLHNRLITSTIDLSKHMRG